MTTKEPRTTRCIEIMVHTVVWLYILLSPLLFRRNSDSIDWARYAQGLYFPLSTCILFYVNYLVLIPRYILTKHYRKFLFYNLLFICLLAVLREYVMGLMPPPEFGGKGKHHMPRSRRQFSPFLPPNCFFLLNGLLSHIFIIGLAIALRLSMQWRKTELALRKVEQERTEAELHNLKNQINPHFLLNTLNNIYALTAFDTEKAQQAIQELSQMLRYMLYDNSTELVEVKKEANFINTYVALMRLRLTDAVEVSFHADIPEGQSIYVAPYIFISLVENAFKHGVSPTHHSFVRIELTAKPDVIHFVCSNSNYPKSSDDKSPGGIGLQQVKSRLELSYPKRHSWTFGPTADGKEYHSEIFIHPQTTGGKNNTL